VTVPATRTLIVTGAAGGLGRQAARILAGRGIDLMLVDRDADGLHEVRDSLAGGRARIEVLVADVTERTDVERYVRAAVEKWGGVDGAFHIAGHEGEMREFVDAEVEEFDRMMAINARSVWYGMKSLLPVLVAGGGGRIVNTGSYVAFHGTMRTSAYGAAKHAVLGMSRGVAYEYAARNIAVNVLAPGAMDTRMIRTVWSRNAPDDPERGRRMTLARNPSGTIADPADVAATGAWLLTEAPVHLTGQLIPVDGGSSI
jgi:3alpha(or 20beta)-hydroxysteroid dehydrogenase